MFRISTDIMDDIAVTLTCHGNTEIQQNKKDNI